MNISTNSNNMYEYTARTVAKRYAAYVSGNPLAMMCAFSATAPSDAVRNALEKSADRLGYGAACAFVTLMPSEGASAGAHAGADGQEAGSRGAGDVGAGSSGAGESGGSGGSGAGGRGASDEMLTEEDVFTITEGLDPVAVVALDLSALQALGLAYRVAFEPSAVTYLLGRKAVGFLDFAGMMNDPDQKQRAWSGLKLLKRK